MALNQDLLSAGREGFMRRSTLMLASASMIAAALLSPCPARAEEQSFYLGTTAVNTGTDTGYSESNSITASDPQFGWQIGRFSITGYTARQQSENRDVFLKNVGDKVALNFNLTQDIDALNGNSQLSISNDENGYDQAMGVEKSEDGFGRGTLIIRKTNYQNDSSDKQIYTNYLEGISTGATTQVDLFEEGDYEVVLDYEIKNDKREVGGWAFVPKVSIAPEYTNYTIRFSFSVRNGNTMVFLFDADNSSELTNEATSPNGFTIDLAQSRYLDINVKREVLSGDHLDTRYNAPAEDGEKYTDEGVYTITAKNQTTGQTTEKVIYVGDNPQLKAYALTGYTLDQIRDMVSQGATIDEHGNIVWPETASESETVETPVQEEYVAPKKTLGVGPIIAILAAAIVGVATFLLLRKRSQGGATQSELLSSRESAKLSRGQDDDVETVEYIEADTTEDGDKSC